MPCGGYWYGSRTLACGAAETTLRVRLLPAFWRGGSFRSLSSRVAELTGFRRSYPAWSLCSSRSGGPSNPANSRERRASSAHPARARRRFPCGAGGKVMPVFRQRTSARSVLPSDSPRFWPSGRSTLLLAQSNTLRANLHVGARLWRPFSTGRDRDGGVLFQNTRNTRRLTAAA